MEYITIYCASFHMKHKGVLAGGAAKNTERTGVNLSFPCDEKRRIC